MYSTMFPVKVNRNTFNTAELHITAANKSFKLLKKKKKKKVVKELKPTLQA